MSTLKVDTLSNVAGSSSTGIANVINGCAKAWVNFNGSGTVAIRASYNVTSITDNGVGDWTVNITNAISDANYVVVVTQEYRSSNQNSFGPSNGTPPTTTACRIYCAASAAAADTTQAHVAIFR